MSKDYTNSEVTHIKCGKVEYLTFNALKKYEDKITCAVTLRNGGVSKGRYSSLNFRTLGNDDTSNAFKNIQIISNVLNINEIYRARQNHTDNLLHLTSYNKEEYEFKKLNDEFFDGYVTNEKNITTLVTTADCNAIVIYDTLNNAVCNIHSGWKGTTKRIYLKAIDKMQSLFNSNIQDLIICVSPAILDCCFSSEDEEFKKIFTDIWKDEKEYIYYEKDNEKRFHINLPYVIKKDLLNKGVKEDNIHFAGICTCCNHDDFYSYRYNKVDKEDYGCMGTIVMLK